MDSLLVLGVGAVAAWWLLQQSDAAAAGGDFFSNLFGGLSNGTTTSTADVQGAVPQDQAPSPQSQTPIGLWRTPASGLTFDYAFANATLAYGLPAGLLSRMAYQESRYNPSAISPAGAIGIMQFMSSTANDFGIDPRDPLASIDAAGRYMAQLYRRFGDWRSALAAYNWGQGNVANNGTAHMPAETVAYVNGIAGDVGV